MAVVDQLGAVVELPQVFDLDADEGRSRAAEHMSYLLALAGHDLSDCVFSGYGDPDGLRVKEEEGDFDIDMPDSADDDALLFYFAGLPTPRTTQTDDPLWYAAQDGVLDRVFIDVYSISRMERCLRRQHMNERSAWMTEQEMRAVRLGTFVLHRS